MTERARVPQRDKLAPTLAPLEQPLKTCPQRLIVRPQRHKTRHERDGALAVDGEVLGHPHGVLEQLNLPLYAVGCIDRTLVNRKQPLPGPSSRKPHR